MQGIRLGYYNGEKDPQWRAICSIVIRASIIQQIAGIILCSRVAHLVSGSGGICKCLFLLLFSRFYKSLLSLRLMSWNYRSQELHPVLSVKSLWTMYGPE